MSMLSKRVRYLSIVIIITIIVIGGPTHLTNESRARVGKTRLFLMIYLFCTSDYQTFFQAQTTLGTVSCYECSNFLTNTIVYKKYAKDLKKHKRFNKNKKINEMLSLRGIPLWSSRRIFWETLQMLYVRGLSRDDPEFVTHPSYFYGRKKYYYIIDEY